MAETIDSLEIEISAKATKANNALDKLVTKLETLSSSLGRLNTGNLTNLASGVDSLSKAMQGMQNVKKADYNRIAKGIEKIASVNSGNLTNVSNALSPLATSLQALSSVNFDNRNLNNIINSITRLANSNVGNVQGLGQLGTELKALIDNIASAGSVERTTSSLVNGIARLANAGGNTMLTANALPMLSNSLRNLITNLSSAPQVSSEITALTTAIAKLASAGSKTKVTAQNLDELSKKLISFIGALQNAPQVSANTISLVNAIANLANAGSSANKAFNSISTFGNKGFSAVKSLANGFKSLIPNINSATKSSKGFVSQIGMFYAKCFLVIRAFKQLGKAITSASDYIEEFNYFNVAITKIADENKKNYKQYGYDDAESYAESFKTRLTELTGKMSGFKIDKNGELSDSGMQNLGLDVKEIMNFESRVAQITNSVGMLGEASVYSSKALTMLSGDLSSLTNTNLQQVMDNLSSGMTGMTAAVKKYGMDISVASLRQYALDLGIQKNLSSMTQAEKMYLRVIAMLDQSKVAWGDLANTINQPANQFRMLKNNIKATGMMIGKLFMPMVSAVLPYLNAMTMAIKDLVQWIGDLFGIKWDNNNIAAPDNSGWDNLEEDVNDTAGAIDKATDAQKKFNKQLMGFDELNNISKNEKDSADGNKGNGNGEDVSGVLSDALINAVEEYEKRWNKAFDGMTSKADELKQKIEEVFKADWKTGDFTDVGATLGTWIKNGLDGIPWDTLQEGFQKVGTSIGTFINGFVTVDGLGETLGTAIANAINTGINGLTSFVDTVEWYKVGNFIADGVNGVVNSDLFTDLSELIAKSLNSAVETIDGFSTEFGFDKLGEKIGNSINTFFGKFNFENMGESISKFVVGIKDTIVSFIDTVNWEAIPRAIADFIKGVDWVSLLTGLGEIVVSAIKAILEGDIGILKGIYDIADKFSGGGLSNLLGVKDIDDLSEKVSNKLSPAFEFLSNTVLPDLKSAFSRLSEILSPFAEFLKGAFLSVFNDMLKPALSYIGDTVVPKLTEVFKNLWNNVLVPFGKFLGDVLEPVIKLISSVLKKLWENVVTPLANAVGNILSKAFEGICDIFNNTVIPIINAVIEVFQFVLDKAVNPLIDALSNDIKPIFDSVFGGIKNTIEGISKAFGGLIDFITGTFSGDWEKALGGIKNIITGSFEGGQSIVEMFTNIGSNCLKGLINGLSDIGNSIVEFGQSIVESVKDFFGIHSPSTVFAELGDYCIQGFINGIKSIGDKIKTTLSNAWSIVTSWWNENVKLPDIKIPSVGDIKEAISNAWTNASDWVKDKAITLSAKVEEVKDGALEKLKGLWDGIKDKSAELLADAKEKVNGALKGLKDGWDGIVSGTKELFVEAKEKVKGGIDKLKSAWEGFTNTTVYKTIEGTVGDTWDIIKSGWDSIVSGDAWKTLKGKAEDTWKNVKKGWDSVVSGDAVKKIKGEIGSKWDFVKEKWGKIIDSDAVKTIKGAVGSKWDSVKEKWGNIVDGDAFKTIKGKMDSTWNTMKTAWKDPSFFSNAMKSAVKTIKGKTNSTFSSIKKKWEEIKDKTISAVFNDKFTKPLKKAWNAIAKIINKAIGVINKIPGVNIDKSLPLLAKGGIYKNGKWQDITKYATGGMPNYGQMFIAREAGPELVGNIGRHTAVVNNDQIVASVSAGVSDAVFNVLSPVLTSLCSSINEMNAGNGGNQDIVIEIDGDNVFRAVRNSNSKYKKMHGVSGLV